MAEHLNAGFRSQDAASCATSVAKSLRVFLGAAVLCAASCALAENLSDPTRPPASLGIVQDSGAADLAAGPHLQSVLIASGRRVAVINGKTFKVGDRFGEARVDQIKEAEVVLRTGKTLQTLKLFPEVEKHRAYASATKPVAGSHTVKDK